MLREIPLFSQADLVLAVSPPLAERWAASGRAVDLLPNGCDHTAYATTDEAQLPSDVRLPQPLAVFVGHLSERIDLLMLEAVAQTGASLLLVGPRQRTFAINRLDALLARPNVQWVGPKPFEELPGYLRLAKVGLTPYADSAFNRGSFPLKTLEYLAAGRAAVVSDLPSVRWLDTDLVTVAGTPEDFARATTEALQAAGSPVLARHRRCFAAEHSWDRRTRDFAQLLQLDVGSRA